MASQDALDIRVLAHRLALLVGLLILGLSVLILALHAARVHPPDPPTARTVGVAVAALVGAAVAAWGLHRSSAAWALVGFVLYAAVAFLSVDGTGRIHAFAGVPLLLLATFLALGAQEARAPPVAPPP